MLMQIDLEKTLTYASEKLAAADVAADHKKQVEIFKKFLKVETERLRIRHRLGLEGGEIARARSHLVDLILMRASQGAVRLNAPRREALTDCAIVALGGYGRGELAPFSDVDILLLHPGRGQRQEFKTLAERVLYLLWDIGLTVGHSFRSIRECVGMAKEDLHSRNAMAESRFIAGSQAVFLRLLDELNREVFNKKRELDTFLKSMRVELEERYAKFGSAVCVQEPNVKESPGGLRDLHTALWLGQAKFRCRGLYELQSQGHISGAQYASAYNAYDFLARVRNEAHFSTGRRTDLLTLELQPLVAYNLGYKRKRVFFASELFMRDYYRQAHELHQFCKNFMERVLESHDKGRLFSRRARTKVQGEFQVREGKLYASQESAQVSGAPVRLIEAFSAAQATGLDISEALRQSIRSNLFLVNRNFRSSPEVNREFLQILQRRGRVARTLRQMHQAGFLGKLLPEFARITFLVQHDHYHQYTIDEHTLRALEALDLIASEQDPKLARFAKVFNQIQDSAVLYLALLLHDCGKGHGRDHASKGVRMAERVCTQLRLDSPSTSQVLFLVKHHLLMARLSQRRDLAEEALIEEFVATVGTLDQLNMLLLLTYADASTVGPDAWNPWKGELLWELYSHARSSLTGSKPARWDPHRTALLKQQIVRQLLPEFLPGDVERRFAIRKTDWWADIFAEFLPAEVERHFAMLPERYLRTTEADQIAQQLRLIKRLAREPLAVDWQTLESGHCTRMTICTRDSKGLFARIAGTLTAHGINILSADINTREDGVVIDTFKVCAVGSHAPISAERWPVIEQSLKAAIQGDYDVGAAVEKWLAGTKHRGKKRGRHHSIKPSVCFDSEASATSTVIEVRAEDEPGLAFKIARTLASLGLNITFAKIASEKNHALDVFYVSNAAGRKLIPNEIPTIERALLEALDAGFSDFRTTVETRYIAS